MVPFRVLRWEQLEKRFLLAADLAIEIEVLSEGEISPGDELAHRLIVTNHGPDAADRVVAETNLHDLLEEDLQWSVRQELASS